jgi:hypothetical protein
VVKVHWHFTTADARVKLKRLYPAMSGRSSGFTGGGSALRRHMDWEGVPDSHKPGTQGVE